MARRESWPAEFRVQKPTRELAHRLVQHISKGSTPPGAVRLEGIPVSRYRRWRETGIEQIEAAYAADDRALALEHEAYLVIAVEKAMAEVAQRLGKQVQNGHEEWRAKLAWLERQERDDFQQTERVDVDVTVDGLVAVEGRAVVGLADVVRLALETGQGHLLGLDAPGDARGELPPARDVLPDSAEGEPAAGALSSDGR